MKRFIILLLAIAPFVSKAQVDTVCYRANGSTYQVSNVPGNTYTWTVLAPGVLVSGQGTNAIVVNWGTASPGLIQNGVSVFATNAAGCVSPPVDLDVFILNIIPTIPPLGPYCVNAPCVTLSGNPPGGLWTGNGISGAQFCPAIAGVGTSTITYTYSLAGCTFTANSSIVVNPLPTISPITHN